MSAKPKEPKSLVDFVKAKKRADCPVCALPEEIRAQLHAASEKKIYRADQLAWLKEECGHPISGEDLNRHYSGRHAA